MYYSMYLGSRWEAKEWKQRERERESRVTVQISFLFVTAASPLSTKIWRGRGFLSWHEETSLSYLYYKSFVTRRKKEEHLRKSLTSRKKTQKIERETRISYWYLTTFDVKIWYVQDKW